MSPFNSPLRIVPRISPRAILACYLLHGLLLLLAVTGWPWSLGLAVCGALIVGCAWATARELTEVPRNFAAVLLTSEYTWMATDAAGNRHAARQIGAPVITAGVILVPFRIGARRYAWIAAADTTPPELLRRLRVRLRYGSSTSARAS